MKGTLKPNDRRRRNDRISSSAIATKTSLSMLTKWSLLLQMLFPSLVVILILLPIVPAFTVTTWTVDRQTEKREIMKSQQRVPSPSNSYLTSMSTSLSKENKKAIHLVPHRHRTNQNHRNHVHIRYKNDYNQARNVVLSVTLENEVVSHSQSSLRNSLYKARLLPRNDHSPQSHNRNDETMMYQDDNTNYSPLLSSRPSKDGIISHNHDDDRNYFWRIPRSKQEIVEYVQRSLSSSSVSVQESDINVLSEEPPLITIDNFISPQDCQAIIQRAKDNEMSRSLTGSSNTKSSCRTSETAWLHDIDDVNEQDQSHSTYAMRFLTQQIANLSGLPPTHHENLQVARYRNGQKFDLHTDHMDVFNELDVRARLATCLIYLNSVTTTSTSGATPYSDTNVCNKENFLEGGNTYFPEYNASISPKMGTAVFWWNTIQRPGMTGYHPLMFMDVDMRMRHEGQPVIEGEKWICNRWIHPIDIGFDVKGL